MSDGSDRYAASAKIKNRWEYGSCNYNEKVREGIAREKG